MGIKERLKKLESGGGPRMTGREFLATLRRIDPDYGSAEHIEAMADPQVAEFVRPVIYDEPGPENRVRDLTLRQARAVLATPPSSVDRFWDVLRETGPEYPWLCGGPHGTATPSRHGPTDPRDPV